MSRRIVQMSRPFGRRILRIVDEHQYLSETTRWVRPGTYTGGEIWALSPSYEDVQYAISQAQPGDVVRVPAGFAIWDRQFRINKPILLIGAGIGQTIIQNAYVATGTASNDTASCFIYYNPGVPDANHVFRLSGFTLDCDNKASGVFVYHSTSVGNEVMRNFRIDHNRVINSYGSQGLNQGKMFGIYGHVVGSIDNNIGENIGGIASVLGKNAATWTHLTYNFGQADQLFIEDNVITGDLWYIVGSTGASARTCVRYNTANSTTSRYVGYFDIHGNQTPPYSNHAGMGSEVYGNVWNAGAATGGRFGAFRAGRNLVYDNRIETPGSAYQGGPSFQEEYIDSTVTPYENLIDGQPQHVSDCYNWNNLRKGTLVTGSLITLDYSDPMVSYYDPALAHKGVVPRWDVHVWRQVGGFDGSTGMGRGPLSSRPASCTLEGAGYWATDEGRLYRWKSGAWELFYTPYAYPHPYRSHPVLGD